MGTEVQSKGYLSGYHSMRDLNEDSNSCSWTHVNEDKPVSNGHYYNGFLPRAVSGVYEKDVLKQKMLEHEAIFKNQVYELHRVYRTQRDLMEETKRKELHDNRVPTESSLSSSPLGYQTTPEGVQKWRSPMFPLTNNGNGRSSISGASATASPLSCIKEKNAQTSPLSYEGSSSRSFDVPDYSRPPKVRRKLLDLELPASEYIDTEDGEHLEEENVLGMSTYLDGRDYGNHSSARKFLNSNGNAGSQVGTSDLQRKHGLTDLNEPVQVEGTNSAVGSLGQMSCHRVIPHMVPKSQFVGLSKDAVLNPHHVNGMPNNLQLKCQENDKGWLSRVLQGGYKSDEINKDLCKDERDPSSQALEIGHETPTTMCLDSVMASQIPSLYSGRLLNMSHPSSRGVSSWETQSSDLSQKMTTHMHPLFNSSSFTMSSPQSQQSHGIFSNGWHINRSNKNIGDESLKQNGFYHGTSSWSKELPVHVSSPGYGYRGCGIDVNATPEHIPNSGYAKSCNSLYVLDPNFVKDLNLNAVPPNNLSDEKLSGKTVEAINLESKNDGILPWLRPKSACNNEKTNVGGDSRSGKLSFLNCSNQSLVKNESEKVFKSHCASNFKSSPYFSKNGGKSTEIRDLPKILGVPIFEKPRSLRSESEVLPPASASFLSYECEVQVNKKINIGLDINLPCDPDPDIGKQITSETQAVEKRKDTNGISFRHQIDLNSLANEDENCPISHGPTITEKVVVDINLEAPFIPESDNDVTLEGAATRLKATEQNDNRSLDELVKIAAEAIVTLSLSELQSYLDCITDKPSEASTLDPLGWFAEMVSSCGNTLVSSDTGSREKCGDGTENTPIDEIDYFELMTLKLTECREEDYMPEPLVPENIKIEEMGTSLLTNRPRRGQARRGRQRRDFQRDILPGLASLSRHEVTEDIRTFGGLMRATGHLWSSRLGRKNSARNGCGRGRRRSLVSSPPGVARSADSTPLIHQFNNAEVGLGLEDRNLQGWGKTTRRPRRQRCPPGNLPTLPVS